jgi:hypothetical protein
MGDSSDEKQVGESGFSVANSGQQSLPVSQSQPTTKKGG